jgi:hypothetical protein
MNDAAPPISRTDLVIWHGKDLVELRFANRIIAMMLRADEYRRVRAAARAAGVRVTPEFCEQVLGEMDTVPAENGYAFFGIDDGDGGRRQ